VHDPETGPWQYSGHHGRTLPAGQLNGLSCGWELVGISPRHGGIEYVFKRAKVGHFTPEKCEGHYEDALKELLKKKQSGQKIEAPRDREPSKVVNLMDALRRSVETERGGGDRRKPAPRAGNHRAPKKAGRSSARTKKAS
jgi:hypothetical protein